MHIIPPQYVATTNYYTQAMGDDFIFSDQVERWVDNEVYAFTRGEVSCLYIWSSNVNLLIIV